MTTISEYREELAWIIADAALSPTPEKMELSTKAIKIFRLMDDLERAKALPKIEPKEYKNYECL